jgi:hypothetical protein
MVSERMAMGPILREGDEALAQGREPLLPADGELLLCLGERLERREQGFGAESACGRSDPLEKLGEEVGHADEP